MNHNERETKEANQICTALRVPAGPPRGWGGGQKDIGNKENERGVMKAKMQCEK